MPKRRQNKTPKSPEEAKEFMGEQHQDNEVQLERLATITEYEQYKQIENEFRCFLIQGNKHADDPRFISERTKKQNRLTRVKTHCMMRARRQEGLLEELFHITPEQYDQRFAYHQQLEQQDDQEVINLFQGTQGQSQGRAQAQAAAPEPPPPPAPIEETGIKKKRHRSREQSVKEKTAELMKLVRKEPFSDNLEELRMIDEETEKVKAMSKEKEKDPKQKETGTKKGKGKKNRDRDTKFVIPTPAEHEKAIYREDKPLKQKDPDVRPKEKKHREPAVEGLRHADPTTPKQKDPDVRPKEKKYREPTGEALRLADPTTSKQKDPDVRPKEKKYLEPTGKGLRHADPLPADEDIYGLPSASGLGGDQAPSSDSGWFWVPLGEGGPPGVEPSGSIRQFDRYPKPSDAEEVDPLDVDAKFETEKYRALGRRSDIRHNYCNLKTKQKQILDEILVLHQQVQIENHKELTAYDKKQKLQATNEMARLSKMIFSLNNEYQELHEEQWDLEYCVRLCDTAPGKAMEYLGIDLPAPPMLLPVEEEPPPPPPPQPTFVQAMGNLVLSHMERESHTESPFRASDPIGGPAGVAFRTTPARSTAFPDPRQTFGEDFWTSGSKRKDDSNSPPGSPLIGGGGGASAGPAPAPRPPTPPPQEDPMLRMPYGHILPSDQAWSRFSNN